MVDCLAHFSDRKRLVLRNLRVKLVWSSFEVLSVLPVDEDCQLGGMLFSVGSRQSVHQQTRILLKTA